MNLLQLDSGIYGLNREKIMPRVEENGVQTRPVWALNHLQDPYKDCQNYKIDEAHILHGISLCLPSSSSLSNFEINKIINHCKQLEYNSIPY